jgi:hypothetical protein
MPPSPFERTKSVLPANIEAIVRKLRSWTADVSMSADRKKPTHRCVSYGKMHPILWPKNDRCVHCGRIVR